MALPKTLLEELLIEISRSIYVTVEEAVQRALLIDHVNKEKNHEDLNDALIDINEAAKILNVSRSTIFSHKKKGIIPFHRLGRRTFFKRSELLSSLKRIN